MQLELEAGVRIEHLTLDFIRVLNAYTEQLADHSSTIPALPHHCTFTGNSAGTTARPGLHLRQQASASFKGFMDYLLPIRR
jgi:hypothetical protein